MRVAPRTCGMFTGVLVALLVAHAARADVHLPLANLVVALDGDWRVAATWRPGADPRAPARGEDIVTRADGEVVYTVRTGGRTDRPCPYEAPFPLELDGVAWIHDPGLRALCRLENDARLEVVLTRGDPDPEAHRAALAAFAEALAERRTDPEAPPPLRDPRVVRLDPAPGATEARPLPLDTVGLAVAAPDDGYVWRVAEAKADRPFDALVRVFPTFPEVQLLVYRHARRHLATCGDLVRRQAAREAWRVEGGALVRDIARFRVEDRCSEHADGLLEVRVATAPHLAARALEPILGALAAAAGEAPIRPGPSLVPARTHVMRWGAAVLGVALPETSARAIAGVEAGLAFVQRNGVFARAIGATGAGGGDAWVSAALDAGVALAVDPELTLVLALGLRQEHDPVLENTSLSLGVELHSGFHRDDTFGWALRVLTFHLASRQPSVAGTPLVIAWDGVLPSGVLLGVDLRWVDRPTEPVTGWEGAGLVLGVRVGLAHIGR